MTTQTQNPYVLHEAHIMDNCSSGEILRSVVLSLRNGYDYPIPLHRIGLLGKKRYLIAMDLIHDYYLNGECREMHALALKITETYPVEVMKLSHSETQSQSNTRHTVKYGLQGVARFA